MTDAHKLIFQTSVIFLVKKAEGVLYSMIYALCYFPPMYKCNLFTGQSVYFN